MKQKQKIINILSKLYQILVDEGYKEQSKFVKFSLLEKIDETDIFISNYFDNNLFGGAGSIIDIYIDNPSQMKVFDEILINLYNLMKLNNVTNANIDKRMGDLINNYDILG
jgi:hypothetical protein